MEKNEKKKRHYSNKNSNKSIYSKEKDYLNYIKINSKNKIEEITPDEQFQQVVLYTNTLISESEENLGQEINKFFNWVLEENKEGEQLKVCIAVSNRVTSKFKTPKDIFHKSINEIMNRKETTDITLTSDLSENISYVLASIFQKIKKKDKIKNFDDFLNEVNNYNFLEKDILKDYLVENDIKNIPKNERGFAVFANITGNKNLPIIDDYTSQNKKKESININPEDESSLRKLSYGSNLSDENKKSINKEVYYEFKEKKDDKNLSVPIEVLILKRKFQTVKKIKLILNCYDSDNNDGNKFLYSSIFNDYNGSNDSKSGDNKKNNENLLSKKDLENNIFVLFNLKWLFPHLLELEVDLSDKDIIRDQIKMNNGELSKFSNTIKRAIKQTYYVPDILKVKIFDPFQTSFVGSSSPKYYGNFSSDDDDSDNFSLQILENPGDDINTLKNSNINKVNTNNNIDNDIKKKEEEKEKEKEKEKEVNSFDDFIFKYKYMLQMIVIYGYFISKMSQLFCSTFSMPFNFEKEILRLLKLKKIYLSEFQFFPFISKVKMINVNIDFYSLDNKSFEQVLKFLFQNDCMKVYLNFFPSEKFFEPEILLRLLKDNYPPSNKSYLYKIISNEDTDNFLLRKLSNFFESNINKLFEILTIKNMLNELSLVFNFPKIMIRNECYLVIILKLILNLLITIDNGKLNLTSFMLESNNILLNKIKFPFLIDFFDKINIFLNKNNKLTKLTLQLKLYGINNIYRIIPYNIVELSLGEFDYESLESLIYYITSSEFSVHSKLNKLQIRISNSILFYKDIKQLMEILFIEYPKNLKEININTNASIQYIDLTKLIYSTNYNTIENIYLQFSKRSLKDEEYQKNIEKELINIGNNVIIESDNYKDLYFIKRTNKALNIIKNNIMINLSLKYNRNFMDYNIFSNFERFFCAKEKKICNILFK